MPRRVVSTSGSSGVRRLGRGLKDLWSRALELLDLRFFVGDVFAHDRIEFLGFQLVRMQPLVLGRRVVVPGARGGNQFDFIAHESLLTLTS